MVQKVGKRHILGLISPHAGYMYSGPVASHGFFHIASEGKPELVVILCPNHRAVGAAVAIGKESNWQTPLGTVETDSEVGSQIVSASRWLQWDDLAHNSEHSLEVQLPFLQRLRPDFSFVPISLRTHDADDLQEIAEAVAEAVRGTSDTVMLIASTDMTHQESQKSAERKDRLAIQEVEGILRLF